MGWVFLKKLIVPIVSIAGLSMVISAGDFGFAENIKKKDGLNFHVPEDWPIEKRAGIVAPIPTEEYILIKFKEVEEKFQAIKADLASKLEEVQSDVEEMEADLTKEIQETQVQAEPQTETDEDLIDVLERLTSLESAVKRLDRKIINKIFKAQSKIASGYDHR